MNLEQQQLQVFLGIGMTFGGLSWILEVHAGDFAGDAEPFLKK